MDAEEENMKLTKIKTELTYIIFDSQATLSKLRASGNNKKKTRKVRHTIENHIKIRESNVKNR